MTLVPIIGMSYQMTLTNFSEDRKAWPVNIMIGILLSTIGNRPGSMAIPLLGPLAITPKLTNSAQADKLRKLINADTLHGVLGLIFATLNSVAREGAPINGAEGKVRRCFPIMSR